MESERRIRSIAIVHETLSRDAGDVVEFSEIVRPLARLVEETVVDRRAGVHFVVDGDAGELPGEVATPLAVVLNELMQNAVDHAFRDDGATREGKVNVGCPGARRTCTMEVRDDGAGLPDGFSLDRPGPRSHDRAGARDRRARRVDRDAQREGHARRACASRSPSTAATKVVEPRRSRRGSGVADVLAGAWLAASPCGAAGALLRSCRPRRPTPGWWRARTRGTRRSRGTPRRLRAASIWSSATPVVPMGKKSSGFVSRHGERSRHACASQSWVRIQVSAT